MPPLPPTRHIRSHSFLSGRRESGVPAALFSIYCKLAGCPSLGVQFSPFILTPQSSLHDLTRMKTVLWKNTIFLEILEVFRHGRGAKESKDLCGASGSVFCKPEQSQKLFFGFLDRRITSFQMQFLAKRVDEIFQSSLMAAKIQEHCTIINDDDCIMVLKYVVCVPVSWNFGSGSILEVVLTINSNTNTIEHCWSTKVCGWDRCYVRISDFHSNKCEESLLCEFANYLERLTGSSKNNDLQSNYNSLQLQTIEDRQDASLVKKLVSVGGDVQDP